MTAQAKRLRAALRAHGINVSVRTDRQVRRDSFGRRFTEYGEARSEPFDASGVDLYAIAAACNGTIRVHGTLAFASSAYVAGGRVIRYAATGADD